MACSKADKRVNPKNSHHKEKKNLVSLGDDGCYIIVVIMSHYVSQAIIPCTFNLHSATCQLFLNKTEKWLI